MRRRVNSLYEKQFNNAVYENGTEYLHYVNTFTEMCVSMYKWEGLPESVDERFLELCLFGQGSCVFFKDEVLGFLALRCMIGGELDVYQIPKIRTAYAPNGYHKDLNEKNSVIIFNNYTHTPTFPDVNLFSRRLWDIDQTIDINAKAQKTPLLITCTESQRLTLKNIYMQYSGNMPVIFAKKDRINLEDIGTLNTEAPYVADKLYDLRTNIWNEALTCFGIPNVSYTKNERMIVDEVQRSQGGITAARYGKLAMRNQCADMINSMFDLNVTCKFREDSESSEKNAEMGDGEE